MNFEIERISIKKIDFNRFVEQYLDTEKPVIITDIELPRGNTWTKEEVIKNFKNEKNKEYGWYSAASDKELMPGFVLNCFNLKSFAKRKMAMRVFMQPKGHKTFAHYDGNSIHGLNLQVSGSKSWVLISPDTPLRCLPFMYVAMSKELKELPGGLKGTTFKTCPGDLLFIPRYWQHQVESIEAINLNFNWVFTPRVPSKSILGKRESEIVFLRRHLPIVNKAFFPEPIDKYGGEGNKLISMYSHEVTFFSASKRLFIELLNYIFLPFYWGALKNGSQKFKKNNFNI